jgi:hypothetical protein
LLLRAHSELGCDLTDAVFVGDSMTDVQAAVGAGVFPILVLTGRGVEQLQRHAADVQRPFLVQENLLAAAEAILSGVYTPNTNLHSAIPISDEPCRSGGLAPHKRELNGYDACGAHRRGELAATARHRANRPALP